MTARWRPRLTEPIGPPSWCPRTGPPPRRSAALVHRGWGLGSGAWGLGSGFGFGGLWSPCRPPVRGRSAPRWPRRETGCRFLRGRPSREAAAAEHGRRPSRRPATDRRSAGQRVSRSAGQPVSRNASLSVRSPVRPWSRNTPRSDADHPNAAFPLRGKVVVRGATQEMLFCFEFEDHRGPIRSRRRDPSDHPCPGLNGRPACPACPGATGVGTWNEELMYDGDLALDGFLATMDRLQADFERRLGRIERPAPQPALQERFSSTSAGGSGEAGLGLEAIWTAGPRPSS